MWILKKISFGSLKNGSPCVRLLRIFCGIIISGSGTGRLAKTADRLETVLKKGREEFNETPGPFRPLNGILTLSPLNQQK
jgi:hypothetical protein